MFGREIRSADSFRQASSYHSILFHRKLLHRNEGMHERTGLITTHATRNETGTIGAGIADGNRTGGAACSAQEQETDQGLRESIRVSGAPIRAASDAVIFI
jgi:hypothetical protein